MSKANEAALKCRWCDLGAEGKNGRIWLCKKHLRFSRMRHISKYRKKATPTLEWLEDSIPENMICPTCNRVMNWMSYEGRSTMITLQHDRSGELRLICHACNTRHAKQKDDEFYDIPMDRKRCPGCREIKSLDSFWKDNSGDKWKNTFAYCKQCATQRSYDYVRRNREKLREKRREYYHARKASGNPIPRYKS